MKKPIKITLISLGSLLGLVIAVVLVAMYLIFTPARLTSIVNRLTDKFILCENHFESVDLTLFKTFPYAGLEVSDVVLVNPTDFTDNDTLARVGSLTVAFNLRDYLKQGNIVVKQVLLSDVAANVAVAQDGRTNFDIFPASDDTTQSSPFEWPELVDINKVKLQNLNCRYNDDQNNLHADLANLSLLVKGNVKCGKADADAKLMADDVVLLMNDTTGVESLYAALHAIVLRLDADGDINQSLTGRLRLTVPSGDIRFAGTDYVNQALKSRRGALLEADFPFEYSNNKVSTHDASLSLARFAAALQADVLLPHDTQALEAQAEVNIRKWDIAELLDVLPAEFTSWRQGMSLDGKASLVAKASYSADSSYRSGADVELELADGRFSDPDLLPIDLKKINGRLSAYVSLCNEPSSATIQSLSAKSGRSSLALSGRIDDLLGAMNIDGRISANLKLREMMAFVPDSLPVQAQGDAALKLHLNTNLDQLSNLDLAHMRASGTLSLKDLDVVYDSISANSEQMDVAIALPARKHTQSFRELLSAEIKAGRLHAVVPASGIDAELDNPSLSVGLSDFMDSTKPFCVAATFDLGGLNAVMDSLSASVASPKGSFEMVPSTADPAKVHYLIDLSTRAVSAKLNDTTTADFGALVVRGTADYDSTRSNILKQWSPNLDIEIARGVVQSTMLPYMLQMPDFKFNYKPELCEISSANLVFGNSDYYLSGQVRGLEGWLSHEDMLCGDLYFTSNYTNVDDLLDVFSGMGTSDDTLAAMRQEDKVAKEANPFIVPRDVNFTLHTNIREALAFGNELQQLAGDIHVSDGIAVLDQVGFVCKAARMQLTGMYKSPRPNHLFLGLDFHLLDIQIDELVQMIPYVDTLVPMLTAFSGNADFHLAAETYLFADYSPKTSTLRGAAAITAKDLVVLDNETFDKIAKLLLFKKKTENKFDSLDVEMTLFRKEIEMYPSLLSIDKYQVCVSGMQTLDNACDYHLELLKSPLPSRLAVDVRGLKPFDIKLGKVQYADLYRPEKRNAAQQQAMELKTLIRQSLEANVRESTRRYQKQN